MLATHLEHRQQRSLTIFRSCWLHPKVGRRRRLPDAHCWRDSEGASADVAALKLDFSFHWDSSGPAEQLVKPLSPKLLKAPNNLLSVVSLFPIKRLGRREAPIPSGLAQTPKKKKRASTATYVAGGMRTTAMASTAAPHAPLAPALPTWAGRSSAAIFTLRSRGQRALGQCSFRWPRTWT